MGKKRRAQPRKLAGKLREIRARLGLGQAQMATRLENIPGDIYPGLISRFEQGKVEPSLLILMEYARLGGVSMEGLVNDQLKLPPAGERAEKVAGKKSSKKRSAC
jgi:transcriptional regulator with XRE-family HTH domain